MLNTLAYCPSTICDKNKLWVGTCSRTEAAADLNPNCSLMPVQVILSEISRIPANPQIWQQEKPVSVVSCWNFALLCYTSLLLIDMGTIPSKVLHRRRQNWASELSSRVRILEFEFWFHYLWAIWPWENELSTSRVFLSPEKLDDKLGY